MFIKTLNIASDRANNNNCVNNLVIRHSRNRDFIKMIYDELRAQGNWEWLRGMTLLQFA